MICSQISSNNSLFEKNILTSIDSCGRLRRCLLCRIVRLRSRREPDRTLTKKSTFSVLLIGGCAPPFANSVQASSTFNCGHRCSIRNVINKLLCKRYCEGPSFLLRLNFSPKQSLYTCHPGQSEWIQCELRESTRNGNFLIAVTIKSLYKEEVQVGRDMNESQHPQLEYLW